MAEQAIAVEVVVSWGGNPLDSTVLREQGGLSIGPGASSWLAIPALASAHELLRREGADWILSAPSGAALTVAKQGVRIEHGGAPVRLEPAMTAEVALGGFTFFVRTTDAAPEPMPAGPVEWRWAQWLLVAAALHGIALVLFALTPREASALNLDHSRADSRYLVVALDAAERRPEPPVPATPAGGTPGEAPSAPGGEQGGGETEPREGSSPAPRRPGRSQPQLVVSHTTVNDLGTFRALREMSWGDGSSPFTAGNGREGTGGLNDNASILTMPGGPTWGGLRMDGTGHGTCDPRTEDCGAGMVAVNGLTTEDPGDGRVPSLRGRTGRTPPGVRILPPQTTGALSREDVRRTVRRHVNEVRFCYEQALTRRPDAEGRVAVSFVIAPSGAVQSASASSTLSDAQVGSCVANAVRTWTFPQAPSPTGVTYPFMMQSAD